MLYSDPIDSPPKIDRHPDRLRIKSWFRDYVNDISTCGVSVKPTSTIVLNQSEGFRLQKWIQFSGYMMIVKKGQKLKVNNNDIEHKNVYCLNNEYK